MPGNPDPAVHRSCDNGQPEKILEAMARGERQHLEHWVDRPDVILAREGFPRWQDGALPPDRTSPRFVHIDLSATHDACGIAIVRLDGMATIGDPENPGIEERKPRFIVEGAISIRPDPDNEIINSDVRGWLMQLVDRHSITIHTVTMDGYQSRDTLQILRRRGIIAEELSVDSSSEAYEAFQEALYEDRLSLVASETLRRELIQLERNPETGRIDHPPRGSKDVADAVAGAVFSALRFRGLRRETGYFDEDGQRVDSRPPRRRRMPRPRPGFTPGFPEVD